MRASNCICRSEQGTVTIFSYVYWVIDRGYSLILVVDIALHYFPVTKGPSVHCFKYINTPS